MLKKEGDKEKAFDMASQAIGSASDTIFFIANYTHESNEKSFVVERTALDILDFALLSAEGFIQIKKQREKNQLQGEVAAGGEMRMIADESWRDLNPPKTQNTKGTTCFSLFVSVLGRVAILNNLDAVIFPSWLATKRL